MINFEVSFLTDNEIGKLFLYIENSLYTYYNNMVFIKKKKIYFSFKKKDLRLDGKKLISNFSLSTFFVCFHINFQT